MCIRDRSSRSRAGSAGGPATTAGGAAVGAGDFDFLDYDDGEEQQAPADSVAEGAAAVAAAVVAAGGPSAPVPLRAKRAAEVGPRVVSRACVPADLPRELDLLQVLTGDDAPRVACARCGGAGEVRRPGRRECAACRGKKMVSETVDVACDVPPGARDGHVVGEDLQQGGER